MTYVLIFLGGVVTGIFITAATIMWEAAKSVGKGLGW